MIDVKKHEEAVKGPGKFEGCAPEDHYYYERIMDGDGESDGPCTAFDVEADEAEAFGLTAGAVYVIREDDSGFIYGGQFNDGAKADAYMAQFDHSDDDDDDDDDDDEFRRDPRSYALALVDDGGTDARTLLSAALGYMSHDDVRGMLDANELSPRFK